MVVVVLKVKVGTVEDDHGGKGRHSTVLTPKAQEEKGGKSLSKKSETGAVQAHNQFVYEDRSRGMSRKDDELMLQ